jgi:hypothetical protein
MPQITADIYGTIHNPVVLAILIAYSLLLGSLAVGFVAALRRCAHRPVLWLVLFLPAGLFIGYAAVSNGPAVRSIAVWLAKQNPPPGYQIISVGVRGQHPTWITPSVVITAVLFSAAISRPKKQGAA